MTSAAQIRAIHTLKTRAGLADDDYRALLLKETGQSSSKSLSDQAAGRFLEVLKGFAGQPAGPRPRAGRLTGRYAPVLQALWLSAWNLGLTRTPDDAALLAFVQRQAKVSHTRFLTDHAAATAAIEGLKAWIARDGGVLWPADREDPDARKRAVALAIVAKLHGAGVPAPALPGTATSWDLLIAELGALLRASRQPAEAAHG